MKKIVYFRRDKEILSKEVELYKSNWWTIPNTEEVIKSYKTAEEAEKYFNQLQKKVVQVG